ncbi:MULTISPECIES: siderophore-interacting protein [unclassified Corynebacterium]|uniref:siderophore-interacting protein n=1 Tax=unclassified Corynebacterium TaxID=2624378 RepID=UPI0029CA00DF|nr:MULTISPECIES: siderophore-interacting protein [unclassified Corynebacterium]WPF65766.1 siderophore-interacting protein [Corynebacterium sp. 22KM0430]WPF68260.1 siderophore-interacting protein [Corynebacterium sp. 21KM1197]
MGKNSRDRDIYPISVRELEVLEIQQINSGMRRVVFGGEQLAAHSYAGFEVPHLVSDGFDDDVRLIFPDPATGARPRPEPDERGINQWSAEVKDLFRTYTVRRWEPEVGRLTVDFAHHEAGLADEWARAAQVGDRLWVAGPKNCLRLPTHTDWLLLVGDETALPAMSRCLEELPAGHRCLAIVEVARREHIQDLSTSAEVDLRWVVRAEGGSMVEAVAQADFLSGTPYAWVAGEAGSLRQIRRDLKERGVAPENLEVTGYWRDRPAEKKEEDKAAGYALFSHLAALLDPVPGFATRAAMRAGVFAAIADRSPAEVPVLARATGLAPDALARLLRYLESLELVAREGTGYRLTALSHDLADEESHLFEHLAGVAAHRTMAVAGIEEVLASGAPRPVTYDAAEWEEEAEESAQWVAPALVEAVSSGDPVAVCGPGARVYAEEFTRRGTPARAVAWADLPEVQAGVVILVDPFGQATATEVSECLVALGACGGRVALLTRLTPEGEDSEHDFAEDIVRLCLDGTRVPTAGDVDSAARAAGWRVARTARVGWSSTLLWLER